MAVILNASTSSGLVQTADTSGEIVLQNNGTTRLTVNASGVTIPSLTATTVQGTIVQGTAVASTSGTSIDFTGIPSWAKRITVMFNAFSTSGSSNYLIQIGTGGSPTSTGYDSMSTGSGGSNFTSTSTSGFIINNYTGASGSMAGMMTIANLTGNQWVEQGNFAQNPTTIKCGGGVTLSGVLNLVRITTANGTDTFDAGTINIQYEG